jgi:hypothetical protein
MTGQVEKRSIEELAVFRGRPAFSEPHHVGRPNIGDHQTFLNRPYGHGLNDASAWNSVVTEK